MSNTASKDYHVTPSTDLYISTAQLLIFPTKISVVNIDNEKTKEAKQLCDQVGQLKQNIYLHHKGQNQIITNIINIYQLVLPIENNNCTSVEGRMRREMI